MFKKINQSLSKQQLTIKEVMGFSLGQLAITVGGTGVATYLNYFWTDILIIPLASISVIMLISRIWDGTDDILFGWLIDRTKTKYGKARPWLLWFFIPATIANIMMFYVPNLDIRGRIIYAFISYNAIKVMFGNTCQLPIQSLGSLITPDKKGRVTLGISGQVVGSLGNLIPSLTFVTGIALLGGGAKGYFYYFGILAVITGILLLLCFFMTTEKVCEIEKPAEDRIPFKTAVKSFIHNKWWIVFTVIQLFTMILACLLSGTLYYTKYVANNPGMLTIFLSLYNTAQMLTPFAVAPFINKVGKIQMIIIGTLIGLCGFVLPLLNMQSLTLIYISAILRGVGFSTMFAIRSPVLADVADFGEWKTKRRTDALVYSAISMSNKFGMGIGSIAINSILAVTGYVGGAAVQTASALGGIVFLFTWFGAICSILMLICLIPMIKFENSVMPRVRDDLKKLRNFNIANKE